MTPRRLVLGAIGLFISLCGGVFMSLFVMTWVLGISWRSSNEERRVQAEMEAHCAVDACSDDCLAASRRFYRLSSGCGDDPDCIDAGSQMHTVTEAMCRSRR